MPSVTLSQDVLSSHERQCAEEVLYRPPTEMIRESLNSRFDIALSDLEARTCHSWKMALDRSKVVAAPSGFAHRPQITVRSSHGCRVRDIDGNAFIDLTMGFGANLLGHAPEIVENALLDQIKNGWNYGLHAEAHVELAELIRSAVPTNERVHLCTTGNEATSLAMRAARAYTGKDVIGVFDGSYHGTHDYALITADPVDTTSKTHIGLGIPDRLDDLIEPLPYGSPDAFERIRNLNDVLAAVIVEPVRASSPHSDGGTWLRELEQVCASCGVLLIVDEVLTGFRLAYGGGSEYFKLRPDLTTYGGAMAGGLPMGAVAGRVEVMQVFSPGTLRPSVFSGNALAGNPLSMAAAIATLSHLHISRATFYDTLDGRAISLATRLNTFWTLSNAPIHIQQCGSVLRLVFRPRPNGATSNFAPVSAQGQEAFYIHLLNRGVSLHETGCIYLSAAHTDDDINAIVDAATYATQQIVADGFLS